MSIQVSGKALFWNLVAFVLAVFVSFTVGAVAESRIHPTRHSGSVTCGSHIFLANDILFFQNGKNILGLRLGDGTNVLVPADQCDIQLDLGGPFHAASPTTDSIDSKDLN